MVRNVAVRAEPAEPAIGQFEGDLLPQPTLRTNAEAIADKERPLAPSLSFGTAAFGPVGGPCPRAA